jgi:hypothetical protein
MCCEISDELYPVVIVPPLYTLILQHVLYSHCLRLVFFFFCYMYKYWTKIRNSRFYHTLKKIISNAE